AGIPTILRVARHLARAQRALGEGLPAAPQTRQLVFAPEGLAAFAVDLGTRPALHVVGERLAAADRRGLLAILFTELDVEQPVRALRAFEDPMVYHRLAA